MIAANTAPKDWAAIATKVMPPPVNEDRTWAADGNTDDIVQAILSAEQWNQDQTAALAPHLKGESDRATLRNVWFFVRSNIRYVKDRPGHERVKLPAKTWADRSGDCKSMSVFIAGILKNLGIPAKYRFVSFRPGPVTHVYVVATPHGQRPIIMDAVHEKFDQEAEYHSKKDYPMTKVSVVHGLTDAGTIANEPRQRTPWQTINWGKMTKGELSLALIAHQAEMVKNWYGDPTGRMQTSIDAIRDTLWHGVHRVGSIGNAPVMPWAAKAISRAKMQVRPAGSFYASMRNPLIQGLAPDMIGMPDAEFEKVYKDFLGKGICTPDSARYEMEGDFGKPKVMIYRGSAIDQIRAMKQMTSDQRSKLMKACYEQGKIIKIYNDKLPKSSHHVLYNFIKDVNATPGKVSTKTTLHEIARGVLGAGISGLSNENMLLLLRNGVMQSNMDGGDGVLGPMSPEETIKVLIDGQLEGVGDPATAALALVVTKVVAVISAAGAIAKALRTLLPPKDQVALNTVQGFGTPGFGPDKSDWAGYMPKEVIGPDGKPQVENDPTVAKAGMNWIFPVLIGGGLLLGAKALK